MTDIKSLKLKIDYVDGTAQDVELSIVKPGVTVSKYLFLNCVNWKPLTSLPIEGCSELSYFVCPVSATGGILGTSDSLEKKFVADVHALGKKATFSIGGGAQSVGDISNAVTTNKTAFINNIASHLTTYGYRGLTLDIENTNLSAQAMVDFINALRLRVGPDVIIGCYVQNYQKDTVWAKVDQCMPALSWIAPMLYDSGVFNLTTFTAFMRAWATKTGKAKLLAGVAVNYPATDGGLNTTQYGQVLDLVNADGLYGVGIWENTLYTPEYVAVTKSKFPNIY